MFNITGTPADIIITISEHSTQFSELSLFHIWLN